MPGETHSKNPKRKFIANAAHGKSSRPEDLGRVAWKKHIQLQFYNTQPKAEKSPCSSCLAASAQKSVGRMRLPHKRPQFAAVEHQTPTYPRSFQFGANILSFHSPYFFGKTGDNLAATKFARTSIPHFVCLQRGGKRAFKYKRHLFECRADHAAVRAVTEELSDCGAITPKPQNWQVLTASGNRPELMWRIPERP